MAIVKTLWRAADDDCIVGCASFAADRGCAEAYLDNPGFGGRTLFRAEVEIDEDSLLDLYELSAGAAIAAVCELTDHPDPGAIGVDEWIPRISGALQDAGIEWVRVRESYPADSETWIFVGCDDPEMEQVED